MASTDFMAKDGGTGGGWGIRNIPLVGMLGIDKRLKKCHHRGCALFETNQDKRAF